MNSLILLFLMEHVIICLIGIVCVHLEGTGSKNLVWIALSALTLKKMYVG